MVKSIMAGASACMTASEVIQSGINRIPNLLQELTAWLTENDYESVEQMKGSLSQKTITEPDVFERANYMKALRSYENKLIF